MMKSINTAGFLGYFDILGFSDLLLRNNINYCKGPLLNILTKLDVDAISMMRLDPSQISEWRKVCAKVFSDTILLYQAPSTESLDETRYVWGSSFFVKCAILQRLAFEEGLPLRGAISYGEYYIDDRYIFGKPIVEAHSEENKYEWSGVVLGESISQAVLDTQFRSHPIDYDLIVPYPVPCNDPHSSKINKNVLRWDDLLPSIYTTLDFPPLNRDPYTIKEVRERVQSKMMAHNKCLDLTKIKNKIDNTAQFISAYPPFHC